ncbi:hypothetical protein ACIQWA_02720 [Kitasatospora sp. NPDC098652]
MRGLRGRFGPAFGRPGLLTTNNRDALAELRDGHVCAAVLPVLLGV